MTMKQAGWMIAGLIATSWVGVMPDLASGQPPAAAAPIQTEALSEAERLSEKATQLYEQGQYQQAIPLAQRALAIREKALGSVHPDVAQSLNNLAVLYQAQGNYGAAEPLYQRALAIREKALGSVHPDVAESLNNLAFLYQTQGNYGAAEPLFKYRAAESLYQRALVIREKALGPVHPTVATSLNNLASLYQDQGNYGAAEPLFKRAFANELPRRKRTGYQNQKRASSSSRCNLR